MKLESHSEGNEHELIPLDFSEPGLWYESIGYFTNSNGQEFKIQVRGRNPETIKEYTNEIRASFEVRTSQESSIEKTESLENQYAEDKKMDIEEPEKIELQPELDLEINIEVINTQGIELPYQLEYTIDPSLRRGATHRYITSSNTTSINITLVASLNSVSGYLSGGNIRPVSRQADTYANTLAITNRAFFSSGEIPKASKFYFSVTGLGDTNNYTYGASVSMV